MKILAIESSSLVASAAIAEDETLVAEYTTNFKKTHSQTLMPMIDELVKTTETDLNEIDAIAITKGPGSFTGLRIGAATAKGLALALDRPLIPVSTLKAMAYNFLGSEKLIVPIMDARRDQVYAGAYTFEKNFELNFSSDCGMAPKEDLEHETGLNKFEFKISNVIDDGPLSISELIEKLNAIGEDVIFLGDGVNAFKDVIENTADFPYAFAPLNLNAQRASSVAALAIEEFKSGNAISSDDFAPDYFRESQAERCRKDGSKN